MKLHLDRNSLPSNAHRRLIEGLFFVALITTGCSSPSETVAPTPTDVILEVEIEEEESLSVIIDTDMGKDDILAIFFLLQRPEIQIRAISVSGVGQVSCDQGLRDLLGLLMLVGKENIPIACGNERPLQGQHAFPSSFGSYTEALKDLDLPDVEPNTGPTAPELLRSVIQSSPYKITLLTLGPLTNVAEALRSEPSLAGNISGIFVRGGLFDAPGNAPRNEFAELNIWVDPHAADIVLRSGAPITLVPLDVAYNAPRSELILIALQNSNIANSPVAVQNLFSSRLAATLLLDDSFYSFEQRLISVDTDGLRAGRFMFGQEGFIARVAVSIDPAKFETLILSTLSGETAKASSFDLEYGLVTESGSHSVLGKLVDESGLPIIDAPIQFELITLEGPGFYSAYSISGIVPTDANFGNLGYRVNVECNCSGPSNFSLNEASYVEGDSFVNLVENGDFSGGFESWNAWGSAIARTRAGDSPEERHLDVEATSEQVGYLNSFDFEVTPGASFTATFEARVSPTSIDSGSFVVIFLNDSAGISREYIPLEPASLSLKAEVSDENGSFQVDLPEDLEGQLLLKSTFAGTDTYFPAYSELAIDKAPESIPEIAKPVQKHRIGVRVIDGVGEFYDKETGLKFVPLGVNYVWFPEPSGITTLDWFRDDIYDSEQVARDFAALRERGYNTVRIFIDLCSDPENSPEGCLGDPYGGLNPDTLDKVVDVISVAKEEGIYLILTSNDAPYHGGYWQISDQGISEYFDDYRNHHYLTKSGVMAARIYWDDLMTGLIERGAEMEAVLGWQLLNEQWMFKFRPPLSLYAGEVNTANGKQYDLSDPEQKRSMVSDGVVFYISQLRDVILEHDPSALITMGFFAPQFPNPTSIGGEWYVDTEPLLESAQLDFFDFHAYLGEDISFAKIAENFGMVGYEEKPILLGEFGAFHFVYPSLRTAGRDAEQWIARSCELGFDGWLYWGYYSAPLFWDDSTWGFVDNDNYLMDLLSPKDLGEYCVGINVPTVGN
jgi:pyrimidine-specific ribonucleoside hydrolase